MKLFSLRALIVIGISCLTTALSRAQPDPGGFPATVQYNPQEAIVEGNQPLNQSYPLQIIAPSNLPLGTPVTVTLGISVLTKPATVATDAEALSFISVSPSTLTFSGPNQMLITTVSVAVPLGNVAGQYAFKILPSGWPVTTNGIIDGGATVNAVAEPPGSTNTSPPSIILLTPVNGTTYTYSPASGLPVTVPISFAATVGIGGQPIDSMLALINNTPVNITSLGLLTLAATGTGSAQLTAGGNYLVEVGATNRNGTSWASAEISVVVSAPPPTITPSSPASNSTFSFITGGVGATVPVSFTATSVYGNITALSATLDGSPITLALSGVGSSTTASGSASLTVATPGSHTLVLSSANSFGAATPVTIPFTVTSFIPAPTVSILTPANGANFPRVAGAPPTVVNYTFTGGTTYGTITSVTVTLDGAPITATVNGLNTTSITGSGALSFSAGGPHTLNVTLSNGGATASASTSFTVTQTQPQPNTELIWLPPISLNKTIEGGSTLPIKFKLKRAGNYVKDTTVLIAIYEVFANGSHSTPKVYPYGSGSNPNPPDYAIDNKEYQLNFETAKGGHKYQVEVYLPVSGTMRLLGSKEVNTKKKRSDGRDNNDCDNDRHDRNCRGDRKVCKDHDGCHNDRHDRNCRGNRNDCDDRYDCRNDRHNRNCRGDRNDCDDRDDRNGRG